MKEKHRIIDHIIPADHSISADAFGLKKLAFMIIRVGWRYKRTGLYLLRKRDVRSFLNFLYTKTVVPTGEGSGELIYYFVGGLVRKFPMLAPYPSYVEIEVTTVCNKKCIFCEHTHWNEKQENVTLEQFKRMVDQFPTLRWINVTGEGDPFLNKDFIKMLEYLKQKHVTTYFTDSFDMVTPDISKKLVDIGIDGIYISMDAATKETYDKIKVGCDFDRSVNNIKSLIDYKNKVGSPLPELCFRYVMTSLNYKESPKFIELVRKFGNWKDIGDGGKIHFAGLLSFPQIKKYEIDCIPDSVHDELVKKRNEVKDGVDVVFAHIESAGLPSINRCLAWMEPYIMIGGYALPCCAIMMANKRDYLRQHCLGNVYEKDFKDIWSSERYKRFRMNVNKANAPVPLLCKGCRAYDTKEREKKYGVDVSL